MNTAIKTLIRKTIKEHKRIIFNGNGYDESWIHEAERRGLSNYCTTPDALAHYLDEKNVRVFTENNVLSEAECRSRNEIYLEKYYKTINIEARTMLDMLKKDILPAALVFENRLLEAVNSETGLGLSENSYAARTLKKVAELTGNIADCIEETEEKLYSVLPESSLDKAYYYRDIIIPVMNRLRKNTDSLERITDRALWPIPTYKELMFGVD